MSTKELYTFMPIQKINKGLRPVVFSFFSGCGLLDLGFESQGFEVVFVNDISPSFLKAYKFARTKLELPGPKYGFFNRDINEFLQEYGDDLFRLVSDAKSEGAPIGFIGGPPCPDFSIGGKNKGATGPNGKLSMSYVKLVSEFKPDFFLFENVKGLWQTAKHRVFYDKLKSKIRLSGYCITDRLCNAIEFGVPQDRERVMLFGVACEKKTVNGIKKDLVDFPWEDYVLFNAAEVKKADWPDVVDFGFKDTTPVPNDFKTLTVQHWFDKNDVIRHPNASNYFQPRAGLAKMKTIKEGDDSRKSYKRLHRNRYSPTAAYGNNEVHLHPFKPRRISVAEAMAIQSLPKKFELPGDMTLSDMFKTIGNGVPFLLAEAIAKTIRQYLKVTTC